MMETQSPAWSVHRQRSHTVLLVTVALSTVSERIDDDDDDDDDEVRSRPAHHETACWHFKMIETKRVAIELCCIFNFVKYFLQHITKYHSLPKLLTTVLYIHYFRNYYLIKNQDKISSCFCFQYAADLALCFDYWNLCFTTDGRITM